MLASRDGLDTELEKAGEVASDPHPICSGSSGCQGPIHKDFQLCLYSLVKCGGTTEGRGSACGARTKNLVIKSRDRASARTLCFPGTCTGWMVKLLCAARP